VTDLGRGMSYNAMVSGRDMTRWAVDYAMLVVIAMSWEGEAVELVMIVIVPFVVVPTTTMVVASAGEKASAETTG
jgi:hypothetical protein